MIFRKKIPTKPELWKEIENLNELKRYGDVAKTYAKFNRHYPDPSFECRIAESYRIADDQNRLAKSVAKLNLESILETLGPDMGAALLREKIITMDFIPIGLIAQSNRVVLDGIGKLWESGLELEQNTDNVEVFEKRTC